MSSDQSLPHHSGTYLMIIKVNAEEINTSLDVHKSLMMCGWSGALDGRSLCHM